MADIYRCCAHGCTARGDILVMSVEGKAIYPICGEHWPSYCAGVLVNLVGVDRGVRLLDLAEALRNTDGLRGFADGTSGLLRG